MSTKLGLHVNSGSRNGYGDVVTASPAAVIAVEEGGALVEAKKNSNGRTITIFREKKVFDDAPQGIDHMSPEEARRAAEIFWPKLKEVYALNPADYYQVTNETGGDNPQSLANIVSFETRLMELAEQDGLKLAVASPAGGSPGVWNNWVQYFVPLIRRAGEGGHIYSRHAYGGVVSGSNGYLTKVVNGKVLPADDNAGRPFREASYLRSVGIQTPMVITETGQNGGYQFPGRQAFMEDVARYDQLCMQHENIWSFCVWTYGDYQGRPANIEVVSKELANYLRSKNGAVRPTYPTIKIPLNSVSPTDGTSQTHTPATAASNTGSVNFEGGLNLRSEPSTSKGRQSIIRLLSLGTKITVLENLGDWLYVQAGEDTGYVWKEYVTLSNETQTVTTTQAPVTPTVNGSGNAFDLLRYLRGDGRAYMVRSKQTGNQELKFTMQENDRFFTCKGEYYFEGQGIVCNWEEMWVEGAYIMRGTDTSPDADRYYVQRENGRYGSRWVKRMMRVGESVTSNPFVQFYLKKNGQEHADNSGPAETTITFVRHHKTIVFPTGITCEDVIELKWVQGNETYYYMKDVGLVGWQGLHDGHTPTFNSVSEWLNNDRKLPNRLQIQLTPA